MLRALGRPGERWIWLCLPRLRSHFCAAFSPWPTAFPVMTPSVACFAISIRIGFAIAFNGLWRSFPSSRGAWRPSHPTDEDLSVGTPAIDGKVLRRSFDRASGKVGPAHGQCLARSVPGTVSAWGAERRLVLAQVATDAKSNEITAVPKLLRLLGDAELQSSTSTPPVEADHGRIETRTATASTGIDRLQEQHQWPVSAKWLEYAKRRTKPRPERPITCSVYLLSRALSHERLDQVVQQHWSIENSLRWRLDVVMNEDRDRTPMEHGQQWNTDSTISPFHAIWPSTPCKKRDRRTPGEESSSAKNGTIASSTACWYRLLEIF